MFEVHHLGEAILNREETFQELITRSGSLQIVCLLSSLCVMFEISTEEQRGLDFGQIGFCCS